METHPIEAAKPRPIRNVTQSQVKKFSNLCELIAKYAIHASYVMPDKTEEEILRLVTDNIRIFREMIELKQQLTGRQRELADTLYALL